MSIKPYFQSKNTNNIKLDKLEAPTKLNKLEVPAELDKLEAPTKLDKLEALMPTLEVPQKPTKPTKPTIKRGRGLPYKNPVIQNYLTSTGISVKQSPPIDILVLVQETPFTDLQYKEINRLLKKGVFAVVTEKDIL